MKKLPQYLMPVPDRYADGFFDVVVRDAHSAVIFWDLNGSVPFTECNERTTLAVRATAVGESTECALSTAQTLTLHDFAGHLLLPLKETARDYLIELGWLDSEKKFSTLNSESITLPGVPAHLPPRVDPHSSVATSSMRHARYGQLAGPIERRGFRPSLAS